jgi:hypothetical protein
MNVALLLVAGAAVTAAVSRSFASVLAAPLFERENYRGARLPTAAGICIVVAVVLVEGMRSVVDPDVDAARVLVVAAVVGFGFLGVLDDLAGDANDRGIRGHVAAALRGRLTTGFVKLAGGAAVGLAIAAAATSASTLRTVTDGVLVAAAANLGNLLDRAPGRTVKWALVAYVPLAIVAGAGAAGTAIAPVAGAAAAMLPGDVRERFMLGDAGANVLGGALGIAAVLALGGTARTVVALVLVALNLLSEVVSFSRVIAATPPLRAFDRIGRLAVALAMIVAIVMTIAPPAGAATDDRRMLIVSVPGLTWSELDDADVPVLRELLSGAALAALAPRSVRHSSRPGDAYLTIGAGSRAIGEPGTDGDVLGPDADFAGEPAGGVYHRRTGREPTGHGLALSWPALVRANDREPYDAIPGLLAQTLTDADVATAAIGNADGSDTAAISRERQAALALTDVHGRLDQGSVDDELLTDDPDAPFGVRLDPDAVLASFDDVWDGAGRRAVLVEASDLARTLRYRSLVDADRYAAMRTRALRDTDALLGSLLRRLDPDRDVVMVVAPYLSPSRSPLTVVAVDGPGIDAGYLRSASTQRAGIVTLVDIAPTILDVFDISRPTDMEGRPFEVERSSQSLAHRVDHLVTINAASRFRERLLTPTTIAVVLGLAAIVAATIVGIVDARSRRWRSVVAFAALADLAALPMSYVARAFPLEDLGAGFYWTFLLLGALAVAALATAAARRARQPLLAIASVLTLSFVVLVGDVMTGSNLHLSAAFGYSPTGNSRLYGISNYSFGLLAVASCILGALIAHRWATSRGRWSAIGLMATALVVLGTPIWGSDVGGIIAFTPTVLVFASMLLGRRPRLRNLILAGVVTVGAVVAFGFADLARPPEERAHLGRLFERIGDEGLQPLLSIVERKLLANLHVSTTSFWVAAIPIAVGAWLFLRSWSTRPLAAVHARIPTLHPALVAAAIAAVLGSIVNDSGAIVGGVASLAITTSLVYLTMVPDPA